MSINKTELFKHKPLSRITRGSQPFRLLEIHPCTDSSSQVECTLHDANLLKKHSFKALSYVWGDPSIKVPIVLDSKRYDVTKNCYSALLRLRELDETKVWIDAICIDQTNNEEKCSQIPLMNYIYPAAKEVLVWLGRIATERGANSRETESLVVSLLEDLSIEEIRKPERFLEVAQRGPNPEYRWEALKTVFGHPWFSRLWTHQELALSTSATFVMDYHVLPFDQLRLATEIIHRASDQMTFKEIPSFLNELFEDFHGFKDGLDRARIRIAVRTERQNLAYLRYQRISALNQVTAGTRFKCVHPLDRVYAILGLLSSNMRNKITVDYNQSLEKVYTDFSEALIGETHSLEVLTGAGICQSSSCPSWVQAWNLDDSGQPKQLRYSKYSASCLTRPNYSINRNTNELKVRGITVDSILETVVVDKEDIVKDCNRHITGAKGFHVWKRHFDSYPIPCDPEHAWIRAVTADMDGNEVNSERASPEVLDAYLFSHRLRESSKQEKMHMVPAEERNNDTWFAQMSYMSLRFSRAVIAASVNRTFFITRSGYMGMGPKLLNVGDAVCVVLGCNVPLVLKKNEDQNTLIGECFVWGLMDGEAMRMKRKGEDWLDTFRLK
jgi:Heterokaryon incompatibility protein (HET)